MNKSTYFKIENNEVVAHSTPSRIVIPHGVTAITDPVFNEHEELEIIEIPDTIEYIACGTFTACDYLSTYEYDNAYYLGNPKKPLLVLYSAKSTEITDCRIHPDTRVIYSGAFEGCKHLKEILLTENVKQIGVNAFSNCTELKRVSFNEGLKDITGAFQGCGLTGEVKLPDSIERLDNAFHGCPSLKKAVLGKNVKYIKLWAFADCTELEEIELTDGVVDIDSGIFLNCPKLKYKVFEGAKYLGNSENPYFALIEATSADVTECTPHKDTKIIARSAFEGCAGLRRINIPEGVEQVCDFAFKGCTALEEITVPTTVKSTCFTDFGGSPLLKYNIFDNARYLGNGENPYYILISALSNNIQSCKIHPATVIISDEAFRECRCIKEITIPDSVDIIGTEAFEECAALERVDMPKTMTHIAYSVFECCERLREITIPEGIDTIHALTFNCCFSLERVRIPEGVKRIERGAFENCVRLEEPLIPESVEYIAGTAFEV